MTETPSFTPPVDWEDYRNGPAILLTANLVGRLRCEYVRECDSVYLYGVRHDGSEGFITSVQTPESLWLVLREEAADPGCTSRAVAKSRLDNPFGASKLRQRVTERELIQQFISRKIIGTSQTKPAQPFTPPPSLEDLEL